MRYSNAEDYALLFVFAAAGFAVAALHDVSAHDGAAERLTAAHAVPDFRMTITAKRLPHECRAGGSGVGSTACATLLAQAPRVEMQEAASTQYALLGACNVIDAAVTTKAMTQDQANGIMLSFARGMHMEVGDRQRLASSVGNSSPCRIALNDGM